MAYATISYEDLVNKFKYAYDNNWGYIWGRAGVLWTEAKQAAMNKTTSDQYIGERKYGHKWIGHYVADCSGMFTWAFAELGSWMYHGSDTIWNKYCKKQGLLIKGKRDDGVEIKPGTAVFVHHKGSPKRTHIGLYVGNGEVIEAACCEKGVIKSEITNSKWAEWGELKYVAYSEDEIAAAINEYPTLRKGQRGAFVTKLQTELNKAGFSVGEVDGIFGSKTEEAVKDYQYANHLTPDGIVGPKTWAVLNKGTPASTTYTATIAGLTKEQADDILKKYPQAVIK